MKLNANEQNAYDTVAQLLRIANVPFTRKALKNALSEHTDFPALNSLSDVLNSYHIPNLATRLSPSHLEEIPFPAIFHFRNGNYATVKEVNERNAEVYDNKLGWHLMELAPFIHNWSGVTLLIEPNKASGEDNYGINRKQQIFEQLHFPLLLVVVCLTIGTILNQHLQSLSFISNKLYFIFLCTKFLGSLVSIALVWYSLDNTIPFLRSICQINEKTHCDYLLNSPIAILWGGISWAEVGFFYFVGGFLILLLSPNTILLIWALGVLALPYTFWSVYYQAFVAKQWCALCMFIMSLLWIEFSLCVNTDLRSIWTGLSNPVWWIFAILPLIWYTIKPILQNIQHGEVSHRELQKIKFSPDYIQSFLRTQNILPPIFNGMKVVELGNPDAKDVLIFITNPLCTSCIKAYGELIRLSKKKVTIKILILFAVSSIQNDIDHQVVQKILSLPKNEMPDALQLWYINVNQDIAQWAKKIRTIEDNESNSEQIIFHSRWLELSSVHTIPAIFLNNVQIPHIYGIDEVEKFYRIALELGFANQR